jgi:hypothetical protein
MPHGGVYHPKRNNCRTKRRVPALNAPFSAAPNIRDSIRPQTHAIAAHMNVLNSCENVRSIPIHPGARVDQ